MMKTVAVGLNCDVSGVQYNHVLDVWGNVVGLIDSALKYNHEGLQSGDILYELLKRNMQLWIATCGTDLLACAVTVIEEHKRFKQCRYLILAGTQMDFWERHNEVVENWALQNGCTRMVAYCRSGLVKRAEKHGYSHLYSIISKNLVSPTLQ